MVGGTGTIGLEASAYATVVIETDRVCQQDSDCPSGYHCSDLEEGQNGDRFCSVEVPESLCDEALLAHGDARACWVQTDEVDPVVGPREVSLEPFCIDAMPFPGRGHLYTSDGMTAWDAQLLSELMESGRFGSRRMCSFTEFQAAVAGLEANRAFIYGPKHLSQRCQSGKAIGTDSVCKNSETGVHEYGAIQSHWVRADADFVAHACDTPPCTGAGGLLLEAGDLIVAGGTDRLQTRQAPLTPHTWHDHGEPNPEGCDDMGHDDQPVICADPDPGYSGELPGRLQAGELAWEEFRWKAANSGTVGAALEHSWGAPACDL